MVQNITIGSLKNQAGVMFLMLLFVVAIAGVALASVATLQSTVMQRERETQLLFVGNAYRTAIRSYYELSPNGVKRYPKELTDLLKDTRYPFIIRHLRTLAPDPLTDKMDWVLIKNDLGDIMGVAPPSLQQPFKQSGFSLPDAAFENKTTYRDWQFVHGTPPKQVLLEETKK